MEDYSKINELLMKYSNLGLETSKGTGALMIGKAPHIARFAIINCLYPTLSFDDIKYVEDKIGKPLPKSLKDFFVYFSNGLSVLTGKLSIFGLRSNYCRSLEMARQPHSIIEYNNLFDPLYNLSENAIVIGAYSYDLSKLYMTPDEKVHYCKPDDATSLKTWPSLKDMLIDQIEWLYSLHDDKSVKLPDTPPAIPAI